jgi:hypothetical protein
MSIKILSQIFHFNNFIFFLDNPIGTRAVGHAEGGRFDPTAALRQQQHPPDHPQNGPQTLEPSHQTPPRAAGL